MTEEQILELWNERAAIMEFCSNMTRTQAERAAYYDLRKLLGKFNVPDVIKEKLKLTKGVAVSWLVERLEDEPA